MLGQVPLGGGHRQHLFDFVVLAGSALLVSPVATFSNSLATLRDAADGVHGVRQEVRPKLKRL